MSESVTFFTAFCDIVNVFNFETPVIPEELATVVKSHIQLIVKTEKGFAK